MVELYYLINRIGIMAAEKREDSKGNTDNDSDKEENSLQRQQKRDVKLITHELQRGVSEKEIRDTFREFIPSQNIAQDAFEKAKTEFTKLDTEYRSDKELPREELARLKQNSIEIITDFDRLAQDKSKTALQKRIVEKIRTDSVEDLQDISEAEEKFSDKPYEAFNEAHMSFRRRARAEQPDSFANEVDKLLGDREKKR
ncbi:MAG TPA: hypothetical protein VKA40_03705 [Nitrososphaera sp.]|jgi:hypothetical protein|nr:hypothetical protein [Nitrososphaera sp.]